MGRAQSAEIFSDGTVLIHCKEATTALRSTTLRSTLATFSAPGGIALVRTGDYAPPPGSEPTGSPATFTRATFLPNLNLWTSTPVDYDPLGVVSSVNPLDGRSLGYASSDGGLTYRKIIDTDDAALGRTLVDAAKHLHHIEAFEWFDAGAGQWKIGAIGLLGDGAGRAGQVFVRSDSASFSGNLTHTRVKRVGAHLLTDAFPLNLSESPGNPLEYLAGNDASQAGMVRMVIENGVEHDRFVFRPTVSFPSPAAPIALNAWPYVFQMARLGSGAIVAPTNEGSGDFNPNFIMVGDPTAERWTIAHLTDGIGFKACMPIGQNRFWTTLAVDARDTLWELPGGANAVKVAPALMLGASARDVAALPVLAGQGQISVTNVTGQPATPALPPELAGATPVLRVLGTTSNNASRFDSGVLHEIPDVQPGDLVQLIYWVKPARPDMSVLPFRADVRLRRPDGMLSDPNGHVVIVDVNDWTRVIDTQRVPEDPAQWPAGPLAWAATAEFRQAGGGASPEVALDYYFTAPQVVVSRQPTIQPVGVVQSVAADDLRIALPALGDEWTVMVHATEAMTLAFSLLQSEETFAELLPGFGQGGEPWNGLNTHPTLSVSIDGEPLGAVVGPEHDVFFPTQSVIVITRRQPGDHIELFSARGMGDPLAVTAHAGAAIENAPLNPVELRMASADGAIAFEGALHAVKVWTDRALTAEEIEAAIGAAPSPGVPLLGDATRDGVVDFDDLNLVLFNFGTGGYAPYTQGDTDGDGDVDFADLNNVLGNWERTA